MADQVLTKHRAELSDPNLFYIRIYGEDEREKFEDVSTAPEWGEPL